MTAFDPRKTDEIFESLKERLENRIPELTNFIETSFNYVFTDAFSEQQHEVETAALATQLSGWADYTGKTITDEDLVELGIDGASPAEINEYMDSSHLDQFAKGFGVTRDEGTQAVGTLHVTTVQTVTIPEGTTFGTPPDENGDFVSFETTTSETITGAQEDHPIEIQAVDVGPDGNVPPNLVTFMPNPPVGVDSVTNLNPISGGVGAQSDESLREDVKSAVVESAEGGTIDGVKGFIENNTDAISVIVEEKYEGDEEHGDHPHADVIVFGGEEQNVLDAIEKSHPSGSEHFLVRPEIVEFDVDIVLSNGTADATAAEEDIEEYLLSLEAGDEVYESKIVQVALNAAPSIENVESINIEVIEEKRPAPGELVSNFDNGTLDTQSERWSEFEAFPAGTSNVTVTDTNPVDGTHSAKLETDGSQVVAMGTELDTEHQPLQPEIVELTVQPTDLFNEMGEASFNTGEKNVDNSGAEFFNNIATVDIYASGSVEVVTNDAGPVSLLSFSEGDIMRFAFEYDFPNEEVTVYGENTTTPEENDVTLSINTFPNESDPVDDINFIDVVVEDTGELEILVDSIHVYDSLITQTRNDIDAPFDTNAVTGVTGSLYTVEDHTFVEGTDFVEFDSVAESTDAPHDSIKFLPTGEIPDPESTVLIDYVVKDDISITVKEVAQLRNSSVTTQ